MGRSDDYGAVAGGLLSLFVLLLLLLLLQLFAVAGGLLLLFCVLPLAEHCASLDRALVEIARVGPTGDWLQATANNDTTDNREMVRFIAPLMWGVGATKAGPARSRKGSSTYLTS
jgi:hypothetical protein